MVISRDVIFNKKAILKNTLKEEKHASKNHYNDKYVVQVELETHNTKDDTQNAKRASTKYQQPHSITTDRKTSALSSLLPGLVLRIWFLMH